MLYIIYLLQLGKLAGFSRVWEEAWNSVWTGFLRNLLARKGFLFCSLLRYESALSCSLPPARELRRTGRVCTGVYRPSGQHSSHNFLTMSLKKAVPDCPFHHNPHFDGRDRKLRIAGSVFHPETMAISFLAGMQSERYVATQRAQELPCLCKY